MMRRWNGWGDDADDYPLSMRAREFLGERIGVARPPEDATRDAALAAVPASRLSKRTLFATDAAARLDHARGQSFPDWVAMRSGRFGPVADGVAFPTTHDEVMAALAEAREIGATVIPYGGGTSVVGHLAVPASDRPVVNISLERFSTLTAVDPHTLTATFGAGTPGPAVEAQLRPHGLLLGHFPQSYEYSTVGGWVVTRSSGQQSFRYGRIEQLFHSGRLATPRGTLTVGRVPASSAGPDLREALMGSEGRLGLLTDVTVRVRPLPEQEHFHGIFFPGWDEGLNAVRALAQADVPLSMLRLSNEIETETQLALVQGHDRALRWLERYLGFRGLGGGRCLLMTSLTGSAQECSFAVRRLRALAAPFGAVHVGSLLGRGWAKNRFRGPYLRNSLWEAGYAADTVETCVMWPQATPVMRAIEQAARDALAAEQERVHAFTHLSHVYRQGCSIYSTFVYRSAPSPEQNMERWRRLKSRVSEAIVAHGGTISHQHGVGVDHAPYLPAEKEALGMDLIRAMARELDPQGLMNPGKLFA
jgi:alkyldihydroxyacetonephosphate synthase